MPTAAENNPFRQYIDSLDNYSVILRALMSELNDEQQLSIIDDARFLVHQTKPTIVAPACVIPNLINRPLKETVVEAIDRLKKPYFMLDLDILFNDIAELMEKHILQGLEAPIVIDEQQLCFPT
jgi:hypothetical protein